MEATLKLGACVAAASLTNATCSEGVRSAAQGLEFATTYGWENFSPTTPGAERAES